MASDGDKIKAYSNRFGRPDLERLGLFIEMPYDIGAKYQPYHIEYFKGKNMLGEGNKIKCGTDVGYFIKPYMRLFEGEGHGRIGKIKPIPPAPKPFVPAGYPKKHSCPGDNFGTFTSNMEAFSNLRKKQPPYQREPKNCLSKPVKKGGPGYVDICLNPYPEHPTDRYGLKPKYKEYGKVLGRAFVAAHHTASYFDKRPFGDPPNSKPGPTYVRPVDSSVKMLPPGKFIPTGPGKWPGGCQAGCFNKLEYAPPQFKPTVKRKEEKPFYPQSMALKSFYTSSVLTGNVDFRVNVNNYKEYQPTFTKHLLH